MIVDFSSGHHFFPSNKSVDLTKSSSIFIVPTLYCCICSDVGVDQLIVNRSGLPSAQRKIQINVSSFRRLNMSLVSDVNVSSIHSGAYGLAPSKYPLASLILYSGGSRKTGASKLSRDKKSSSTKSSFGFIPVSFTKLDSRPTIEPLFLLIKCSKAFLWTADRATPSAVVRRHNFLWFGQSVVWHSFEQYTVALHLLHTFKEL
mmetsp:Transcript_50356/g.56185  ORF Transcript_50356/g.56185 Transcript_50356/m.56185 type:complete len:203 (+) Transcript_50356:73-681(+)